MWSFFVRALVPLAMDHADSPLQPLCVSDTEQSAHPIANRCDGGHTPPPVRRWHASGLTILSQRRSAPALAEKERAMISQRTKAGDSLSDFTIPHRPRQTREQFSRFLPFRCRASFFFSTYAPDCPATERPSHNVGGLGGFGGFFHS
jgi:hypothetical protein